jgi:hypothetical protein
MSVIWTWNVDVVHDGSRKAITMTRETFITTAVAELDSRALLLIGYLILPSYIYRKLSVNSFISLESGAIIIDLGCHSAYYNLSAPTC